MSVLVGKVTSVLLKQVRVPEKQEVKHQMARSRVDAESGHSSSTQDEEVDSCQV